MFGRISLFSRKNWHHRLPETLFGRSLLLLIIPLTLVQIVSIFIFFDRHWQSVLRQLADNCATHVGTSMLLLEQPSLPLQESINFIKKHFDIDVKQQIPQDEFKQLYKEKSESSFQDELLEEALKNHLSCPFQLEINDHFFIVYIEKNAKNTVFFIPRKRIGIKAIRLYFAWSLGMSVFLLIIAAIFLRNQMRPLQRLAEAVHHFGKGRQLDTFRPAGTKEVRKVGTAFIVMRDRLQRYIVQRTQMLAGVSHDLRTPLTRMKLQLALLRQQPGIDSLTQDIQEMDRLIQGYLDFASTDQNEASEMVVINLFVKKIVKKFSYSNHPIQLIIPPPPPLQLLLKPHSFERCLNNVIANALRYGKQHIKVSLERRKNIMVIMIDDDGPGIPLAERHNVLRPFYRLEKSRNPETGGVGLGLAIAQDSIRSQGGNIVLSDSPLGGLRVQLSIPL